MRIWPAIVAPLGLTLLSGVAGWLFMAKVASDQERADADALRLEGYARLEAGELAGRARELGRSFLDDRLGKRAGQEKNMRVELRGVMDAVYRVLTAGLEKTRSTQTSHRDVGEFPSGFESLRLFLELADDGSSSEDAPVAALRACATELTALLPPGCSLTVVENNFEELLALGGGNAPDNARTETIAREFIWDDGSQNRHWTLQVRLSEADEYPVPDARELAEHLDARMRGSELSGASWRGWLVDGSGQAAAAFPLMPEGAAGIRAESLPPYIDMPGEWVEIDGKRLVWLERGGRLDNPELTPAVAVAIDRPPAPLEWRDELAKDRRWGLTLGLLGLLSLGTWGWFFRALWVSRRKAASDRLESLMADRAEALERQRAAGTPGGRERPAVRVAPEAVSGTPLPGGTETEAPRRRLVRDDSAPRPVAGMQGLIVADIGDDGEVEVGAEIVRQSPKQRMTIPSGSLLRLQERHRGGKGRRGSRILDQARSQLVRELAKRVRPVLTASPSAPPPPPPEQSSARASKRAGRATERILKK